MKSRQILKTFLASGVLVFLTGCYADLQKADNEMQRDIKDLKSEISSGQGSEAAEAAARAAEAAAEAASDAAQKAEAAAEASQEKAVEAERIFERDLGKK